MIVLFKECAVACMFVWEREDNMTVGYNKQTKMSHRVCFFFLPIQAGSCQQVASNGGVSSCKVEIVQPGLFCI